jgi:hypothetical protein
MDKQQKNNIPVKDWINQYKEQFERYNSYCNTNNWIYAEDVEEEYGVQKDISLIVLDRLKYFVKKFEPYLEFKYVKNFIDLMQIPVSLFLDRCNFYFENNDWLKETDKQKQIEEMKFQSDMMSDFNKLKDKLQEINLDEEFISLDLPIFGDKNIPFLMQDMMESRYPEIQKFREVYANNGLGDESGIPSLTPYDVLNSTEMFLNIKNPPIYDSSKHYFEQSQEVLDFYTEEYKKITQGVNIAGVFIHPLLYWYLNFFKTDIPMSQFKNTPLYNPSKKRLITNPFLRDNELFYIDSYAEADEKNLGLFAFGTRRFGKALKNDEKLYYTDGSIRNIGDAKVGDTIIGGDGNSTKIVGVYPQGKVELYKVKFSDGREIICCDEHLWTVFDYQAQNFKTLPLKEIQKNYKFKRHSHNKEINVLNYYIPISKPINYDLNLKPFIDPYFLGLWIGDGNSKGTAITTIDNEIIEYISKIAKKYNLNIRKEGITYHITSNKLGGNSKTHNCLLNKLIDKNLINNKHIPAECFKWNVNDRLDLLSGLMDSDGTATKGGGISFSQSNKEIAYQFYYLCLELGIHCKIVNKTGKYLKKNNKLNTFYIVILFTEEEVFRLKRKLDRTKQDFNVSKYNKNTRVSICDIEYYGIDEATCIRVDNKDKLFLTSNCVVTHNTVMESAVLTWSCTITENSEALVIGGDESDIQKLSKTLEIAFTNVHSAFYLPKNNNDWSKLIQFGLKNKAGERIPYGDIFIRNVNKGADNASEKTAGTTPTAFIVDEAGKFNCKSMFQAAIPSFQTPDGWSLVPLLMGTGGNVDLSIDAQNMLMNPEENSILPMNWDRLDNMVQDKDLITWKRKNFGLFLPAQMSFKDGMKKIDKSLSEYFNIEDERLQRINIKVTDWANSNKVVKEDREKKKKDKTGLNKEKMYYPIDPNDCFLNKIENPFPALEAQLHKEYLIENGLTGRNVDIYRKQGTKLGWEFSDKDLPSFPFEGGNIDSPVILFEDPPEDNDIDGTYVSGLDHYKHNKASTNSLGANYIFKRNVNLDEWSDRVVACYYARPETIEKFNSINEMLIEGYGAECLQENADISFEQHLKAKHKLNLLANGEELAKRLINPRASQNNKYGLNPNEKNQQYILNLVIDYCQEDIEIGEDEHGDKIIVKGVTKIPDIGLLDEIINFHYGGNFDKLIAFGHALAWARYLDSLNIMPKVKNKYTNDSTYKKQVRQDKLRSKSPYSYGDYSLYKK